MGVGQNAFSSVAGVTEYIEKPLQVDGVEDDGVGVPKPAHWFFGEKIVEESPVQARKRGFQEIDAELDYDVAKKRIREFDPEGFMRSYNNFMNYLAGEKQRVVKPRQRPAYLTDPWKVPFELEAWKRENIDERKSGRGGLLVLVGAPRTGKTQWALDIGLPMEMSKKWNMRSFRSGATHVVVSDCDVKNFGFGGDSFWREVMGSQMSFSASDKYMDTRELDWGGMPCVWTCNDDLDPMLVPEVKKYILESGGKVYYLGDNRLY